MSETLSRRIPPELAESSAYQSARARVARLLDKTIFFALLALITLTAVPYGTIEPWWEAVFECTVFTLGALWIIEGLLGGTWRVNEYSLLVPLLAFVVFALLQTLPLSGEASGGAAGIEDLWQAVSADPYETRRFALKLIALALIGQLLLRYTSSQRRLRMLIHVVIGIGVASALFGIVRQSTQHGAPSFILPYLSSDTSYGQFINRNHFALLMEMTFGLVLGLVLGGGVRRNALLIYLTAALPMWTALVLTTSRGGIFGMLSQLLFLALLFSVVRSSREIADQRSGSEQLSELRRIGGLFVVRAALVLGLVAAMIVSIVWMGGDRLVTRLEAVPNQFGAKSASNREGESRIEVWHATWQLIKANPLVGVGFGGYRAAITEYHDASGELTPQDAHNDYLELLASGGLLGALLGAWFVVSFVRAAQKQWQSTDRFRRAACYGAMAGLCGVAVHSMVDYGLHITINAVVCLTLVVVAVVDDGVEEKTV